MQKQEIGALIISTRALPAGRIVDVVNALRHTRWHVECADESDASIKLRTGSFQVVLCDTCVRPETWRELCATADALSPVPTFVALDVTTHRSSESGELIRQSAWDILELPSRRAEIYRLIHDAWQHSTRDVSAQQVACA